LKIRDFSKLFSAILFLHLVVIYQPESEVLYYISKPLLVFSLLAYFIHKTSHLQLNGKGWVPLALLLSLAGDILLMGDSENYFLGGMGAFFLAHVFYALFYLNQKLKANLLHQSGAVLIVAAGMFVLYQYVNTPGNMAPYLYSYGVLLGVHFLLSTKVLTLKNRQISMVTVGALLFVVSDILIAFNEFNGYNTYIHLMVMLTYGIAQYAITIGLIHYLEAYGKPTEHQSI
jgi:uncharacterized membrane protein YhhN